tara:strand:- start:407 stop:1417 length:1011 start_codon:yes stop_codon:yes gene_type:complete
MATYKEIHGTNIEVLSSDPPAPKEGEMWYNTTSNVLKGFIISSGAWSTGGSMSTARENLGGAGTKTAALGFGGYVDGTGKTAVTEQYNGTSWTGKPNMNTAATHARAGVGTTSAALSCNASGNPSYPQGGGTELWNGSSWTAKPVINLQRNNSGTCGTSTAALIFGGSGDNSGDGPATETWNGSTWTASPNGLNSGSDSMAGAGTTTAGLCIGGDRSPNFRATERWNGSSWTTSTLMPIGLNKSAGGGTASTSALIFGGNGDPGPTGTTTTLTCSGTTWAQVGNLLSTNRYASGCASSNSNGLSFGGKASTPGPPNASSAQTQSFSSGPKTVTVTS